jgi:8-oxo-dGTP diphosphatase
MKKPGVAVSVFIFKGEYISFQKRKSPKKHKYNFWSVPGGKLELFEDLEKCAKRETLEEVGIKIKNLKFIDITNDYVKDNINEHYITIFYKADYLSGKLENKEINKCFEVKWIHKDNLPKKLFFPIKNLFKKHSLDEIYKK